LQPPWSTKPQNTPSDRLRTAVARSVWRHGYEQNGRARETIEARKAEKGPRRIRNPHGMASLGLPNEKRVGRHPSQNWPHFDFPSNSVILASLPPRRLTLRASFRATAGAVEPRGPLGEVFHLFWPGGGRFGGENRGALLDIFGKRASEPPRKNAKLVES
jgi:hypothetical protein